MTNSADPDQLASSEANWSDLHCFQSNYTLGFVISTFLLDLFYFERPAWAYNLDLDQTVPNSLCVRVAEWLTVPTSNHEVPLWKHTYIVLTPLKPTFIS